MRTMQRIVIVIAMAVALVVAAHAQPAEPLSTKPRPLGELLNPDGTLRKDASSAGRIDPRGWQMRTRADGTPYFIPQESSSSAPLVPGDENWDSNFGSFVMDGNVYAMAVVNGEVYLGGGFDMIDKVAAHKLAKWNGSSWQGVGGDINGYVYALAGDGPNLYVGGQFTRVGTIDAGNVAVWNTAGGGWSALEGGVTAENFSYVASIAVGSGDVYVGGSFTSAGDVAADNIARWNKSAKKWSALGAAGAEGTNGEVLAVRTSGTTVWVGGSFTTAGGAQALNAAGWDIGTGKWRQLGAGLDGYVNAIGVARYGVYFGGGFSKSGSTYLSNFARWDNKWRNCSAFGYVRDIVFADPLVIATGEFTLVGRDESNPGPVNDNFVGAFGHDTSSDVLDAAQYIPTWRPFGNKLLNGMDGYTNAVAVEGTDVYFGGSFRTAGKEIRGRIAIWDSVAHRWRPFGVSISGPVQSIIANGNEIYVAGTFEPNVGSSISTIVKWDGNAWSYIENNIGGTVSAMAYTRGDLYVGGHFKQIDGVWCNNIARLNLSQNKWFPLDTGVVDIDTNNVPFVGSIAISGDNLYAGGFFTNARDLVVNNIARWNIAEGKWYALRNGVSGYVRTVTVDAAGTPYIGGALAVPGETTTFNVARWDGDRWRIVGGGLWGSVAQLVFRGNDLYAVGNFVAAGDPHDSSVKYVAWWDGSSWHGFGRGIEGPTSTTANSIAFDGSDTYVAGYFSIVNGDSTVNNIVRWDGSRWWPLGSGTDDGIFSIATAGKSLYAGGRFLLAGQKASFYFGRWNMQSTSAVPASEEVSASLEQNMPNPFGGETLIGFTTTRPGHVTLKVFDINGSEVATLVSGYRPAGEHAVTWHAGDVPAGAYYYRLQCGGHVETKKLMVMR